MYIQTGCSSMFVDIFICIRFHLSLVFHQSFKEICKWQELEFRFFGLPCLIDYSKLHDAVLSNRDSDRTIDTFKKYSTSQLYLRSCKIGFINQYNVWHFKPPLKHYPHQPFLIFFGRVLYWKEHLMKPWIHITVYAALGINANNVIFYLLSGIRF